MHPSTRPYEIIDHTADLGIRIFGTSPETLFANAAAALFQIITDSKKLTGTRIQHLQVSGQDWPDLMVGWLRELLFLWNAKELLVKEVQIERLSENDLSATVTVDRYHPDKHPIHTDIKAVTYHQIDVFCNATGWQATVIFDV